MKKVFIILTVVLLVSFSSLLLANDDFIFPGITTKEQVRLELWVKGINHRPQTELRQQKPKLNIELEQSLGQLKL